MRISRIYCAQALNKGATIHLNQETSHYLRNVLRLKTGGVISVFNAEYGEFMAKISALAKREVIITLEEKIADTEQQVLDIHLGQGLSRGEKMDYTIQKATELGVSTITPLYTEHCNVKLSIDRVPKRVEHWQKIATNAAEQCGRITVPVIKDPIKLNDWLAEREEDLKLICHKTEESITIQITPQSVALLIGPEGGLSEAERDLSIQANFQVFGLGPRVLRTETASISAISLLQARFGDMASCIFCNGL